MDFQELESREAMGAGEIELLFNFIVHLELPPFAFFANSGVLSEFKSVKPTHSLPTARAMVVFSHLNLLN